MHRMESAALFGGTAGGRLSALYMRAFARRFWARRHLAADVCRRSFDRRALLRRACGCQTGAPTMRFSLAVYRLIFES